MTHLVTVNGLPIQQACRAVGLGRATYYRPLVDWAQRDAPAIAALTTLVAEKSRWGFWKCADRLRNLGHPWNHKRLGRVYGQLKRAPFYQDGLIRGGEIVMRKAIRACVRSLRQWLNKGEQISMREIPFDNRYDWLGMSFRKLSKDPVCSMREAYIWGVLQGAALGKVLGLERISVIEFGVAGGRGLLAMEKIAERAEEMVGIRIDVYGFGTETGLPKPEDYRDLPNEFLDGQYAMDKKELENRLCRAQLKLGLVKETVPAFLESKPAPVAFVSYDLDLYSSTRDALKLFEADSHLLLPRVLCYFDDILGYTFSDYNGERLAISEFNSTNSMRKLSPVYGLRYFVPGELRLSRVPDMFYFLHIFDHPLYNRPDRLRKHMRINIEGQDTDFISTARQRA